MDQSGRNQTDPLPTQPFAAVDAYVVELERLFEFTRYLHRSSGRAYPDTPLLALPPSQFCLKLLNPQRPARPTRGITIQILQVPK